LFWYGASGTVRNVIDFGAFVISALIRTGLSIFLRLATDILTSFEVLKVGEVVKVWVISVDASKKRISLTMKKPERK
jgi:uncharacterized protein